MHGSRNQRGYSGQLSSTLQKFVSKMPPLNLTELSFLLVFVPPEVVGTHILNASHVPHVVDKDNSYGKWTPKGSKNMHISHWSVHFDKLIAMGVFL